MVLTNY